MCQRTELIPCSSETEKCVTIALILRYASIRFTRNSPFLTSDRVASPSLFPTIRYFGIMSNDLFRLCGLRSWSLVEERARHFPHEAIPSEAAKEGESATVLSLAVRMGAPLTVIQSLVDAVPSQVAVVHRIRGSVLHDALGHGTFKTFTYILLAVKQHASEELLCYTDDLGRTALHCLILHAMRAFHCPGTTWKVFRELVLAYPPAVGSMDCDGNTPLLLILLNQDTFRQNSMSEGHILRMVKLMVTVCPQAVTLCRTAKRVWPNHCREDGTIGDGVATPLTYAMLYGRSEAIIGLLLDASRKVGSDSCMMLVSGYREVPLHMALSLRSSISLLRMLVEEAPQAMMVRDIHNLTPLEWLWIRHALDWCNPSSTPLHPVSPSTRRFLPHNFCQLHDQASREDATQISTILQETLFQRMRIVLPAFAAALCDEPKYKQGEPWSVTHAACFVKCPLSMVRLALRREGVNMLRKRDLRMGRMPLHYAASRTGYAARIPVGPMSESIQKISEPSPLTEILSLCPEVAHITDSKWQLPLHIAIDTARKSGICDWEAMKSILAQYPDSLERRDGRTKLFPFMQAAVENQTCLDIIFLLLLDNPALARITGQ